MSPAHPGRPAEQEPQRERRVVLLPWWTSGSVAVLAVLARLPFLGHPPGPDEAGFLLVGAQWDGPGSSLYGDYWVDRPPLLITIFRFGAELGGLTALRLIGSLAVFWVIVGSAWVARLLAGVQAARWTAITAAALCLSPLLGGYAVNGELLAAPFVVAGFLFAVAALHARSDRTAWLFSSLVGMLGVSAILVKQNLADVAVFAFAAFVAARVLGEIGRRRLVVLLVGTVLGAVVASWLASLWTTWHGTSLGGVFEAMYPFRVRAADVIASAGRAGAAEELSGLLGAAVVSGIALVLLLLGWDVARRQRRNAFTWALLATLLFGLASVLLGGSYWHHYLIQLIAPAAIAVGVITVEGRRRSRTVILYVAAAAVVAWGVGFALPDTSSGSTAGTAVREAARPGDTIISVWGHPDVVLTSGLRAPYEHLWSLPVRTLDPDLDDFHAVLTGPEAPTWLVFRPGARDWELPVERIDPVLARDYREVATICGLTIYVRADVDRPVPRRRSGCDPDVFPLAGSR